MRRPGTGKFVYIAAIQIFIGVFTASGSTKINVYEYYPRRFIAGRLKLALSHGNQLPE